MGKRSLVVLAFMLILVGGATFVGIQGVQEVSADTVTPSTNADNEAKGWAHVVVQDTRIGELDMQFISTRGFYSCFEYRTDGDTSQKTSDTNYNPDVTDGLYPFYCLNNSTRTETISANEYVEVRMVFGAERDERFDWTRFDVLYPRIAKITSPTEGQDVYGLVNFSAYLDDNDVDPIQWAVRQGTCDAIASTNVFGNVSGVSDVATIDTSDLSNQAFTFTGDMSAMMPGMYCFIYNPKEDSGESNIRETVEFNLINSPTDKNQCKVGGWKLFSNPSFKNQGDCVSYVQSSPKAVGNKTK